jgi:hypothetical protein
MKTLTMLGMAVVTVGLATVAATTAAQDREADGNGRGTGRQCDEGTLRGKYGYSVTGLRPGVGGAPEQFVGVALATFDGHGHFTQVDNVHGPSGATTDRQNFGTYTVNADCSGTSTLHVQGVPFPIETRDVIVDNGTEIRSAVVSPPPIVVSSVGRKVF